MDHGGRRGKVYSKYTATFDTRKLYRICQYPMRAHNQNVKQGGTAGKEDPSLTE